MYSVREIGHDFYWVGCNDRGSKQFAHFLSAPFGMSYHAYLLTGPETVLVGAVPMFACPSFADKIASVLDERPLDYLVLLHWEEAYADTVSALRSHWPNLHVLTAEQDTLQCGSVDISVLKTPVGSLLWMPEEKILFSDELFGSFGAMSGISYDSEMDLKTEWLPEARRYFAAYLWDSADSMAGLLTQVRTMEPAMICPNHGPIWCDFILFLLEHYENWLSFRPETPDVLLLCDAASAESAEQLGFMLQDTLVRVKILDPQTLPESYVKAEILRCAAVLAFDGWELPAKAEENRFVAQLPKHADELTGLRNRILTYLISKGC